MLLDTPVLLVDILGSCFVFVLLYTANKLDSGVFRDLFLALGEVALVFCCDNWSVGGPGKSASSESSSLTRYL